MSYLIVRETSYDSLRLRVGSPIDFSEPKRLDICAAFICGRDFLLLFIKNSNAFLLVGG